MRFARLDLLRYGSFAERRYDFASDPLDLQVLYGANEAGKSTTLSAIGDLLFGFPHHKGQDWRFDASQLRVGACLERDGEPLSLIRRRGTKQTLLAEDGSTPLDENRLLRWLGGVDRGAFERLWSLDHERLRLGGEAMAHFEDDLGQQLLAAGFGLDNVQNVLDTLEAEAGAIWRKNGRSTRLNELRNRLGGARQRLGAAEKDSQRWTALNREIEEIDATLETMQTTLRDIQQERATLERIDRLRTDLDRHAQLTAWLATEEPPLFTREDHDVFDEGLSRYVSCQQNRDRLAEQHESARAMRAACTPDLNLLAHEDRIDGFQRQQAHYTPLRAAWPDLERTLEELNLTLHAAGLKGDHAAMLDALPDQALLENLRPLANRNDRLTQRETECREACEAAQDRLARARSRLDDTPAPPLESLAIALQQAERRSSVDAELSALACDHQEAATRLAAALRDLTPWEGTPEALHAMAVPEPDLLDRIIAAWRTHRAQHETLQTARDAVCVALDRQTLAKTHLEQRQIVSAAALLAARKERDALFDSLTHGKPDDALRTRYLDAVSHADTLADRRFEEAEESAKLTQIDQEIDRLTLERQHLETQQATLDAHRDAADRDWQALLAARALPALDPETLRSWLVLRDRALTDTATLSRIAAKQAERATQRLKALDLLRRELPDMPPAETVADAILQAQHRHASWQREADRLHQIRADIEQEERSLSGETRKNAILAQERKALAAAWTEATASRSDLSLQSIDGLDRLIALRNAAQKAVHLRGSLDAQKHEATAFDDAVIAFATELHREDGLAQQPAQDCLEGLVRALHQARIDRGKAKDYDLELARTGHALTEAEQALSVAAQDFTPFIRRLPSGMVTQDETVRTTIDRLRSVIMREKTRYAAQDEYTRLEQRLHREAALSDLDALHEQARDWPAERIALHLTGLADRQEEAERQREEKIRRQGEITNDMRQIEQAHNARDAALDIEICRTEMASAAEAWATARIQTLVLTHVARRQRDENTNPLLKSAEAHFAALTCGRYRKLTIDEDGKAPELAAMLDDERMIRPGAMSEGTRDQLFLSLRLAALDQARARGVTLPFVADDLFITFDEQRAAAGFATLSALARHNQILFMTHHAHLAEMAAEFGGVTHNV